jgi:hypothetical protein
VCELAEQIVGGNYNGATTELAGRCGISVSQVENLARAGLAWKSLEAIGIDSERRWHCRKVLPITHWTAFMDLWVQIEFDPTEAFETLYEAAGDGEIPDKIITVTGLRKIIQDLYGNGGRMDWEQHLKEATGKLKKLKDDYGVPEHIRLAAEDFIKFSGSTATKLIIEDARPLSWNTLWSGQHWADRARIAHEWHNRVRAAIDVDADTPNVPVYLEFQVFFKDRPQDIDNPLYKPMVDGMKGWLIPDDDNDIIKGIHVRETKVDKERPRIEITILSLPGSKPWENETEVLAESEV